MVPSDPTPREGPLSRMRKAVLICPECGYEDLFDGAWTREWDADGRTRVERCPECSAVVDRRPVFDGTPDRSRLGTADVRVADHWPWTDWSGLERWSVVAALWTEFYLEALESWRTCHDQSRDVALESGRSGT